MGHTQLKPIMHRLIYWSYVHLMVSFFSLLILSCWGLGLSPLTIAGNVIFSPVLSLFLLLSTIIFFSELVGIPNSWLIYALEIVNQGWIWCLQLAKPYFCPITCIRPSCLQLLIMTLAAFAILLTRTTARKKIVFVCLLIGYSFYYGFASPTKNRILHVPCNQGSVTVIQCAGSLWVIDAGYIGQTSGAASYIEYRLLASIIREFGTHTIDYWIVLQPGVLLFKAMQQTVHLFAVKQMYIPLWQGSSPSLNRAYRQLKETAANLGITIMRKHNHCGIYTPDDHLCLQHITTPYKKGDISVDNVWLEGCIDKQPIAIYAATYSKSHTCLPPLIKDRPHEEHA